MTSKFILSLQTGINNLLKASETGKKNQPVKNLIPADNNKQNT
jgi:hypothetical protein